MTVPPLGDPAAAIRDRLAGAAAMRTEGHPMRVLLEDAAEYVGRLEREAAERETAREHLLLLLDHTLHLVPEPEGCELCREAITLVRQIDRAALIEIVPGPVMHDVLARVREVEAERDEALRGWWSVKQLRERCEAAEATVARQAETLRSVISACAPPVEAMCAVHSDAKYIAPETLDALLAARDALRAARAVLASPEAPAAEPPCRACGAPEWKPSGGVFSPADWRCPGGYLAEDCPNPAAALPAVDAPPHPQALREPYRCSTCEHSCCDHSQHSGACSWSNCKCERLAPAVDAPPEPTT